MTLSPTLNSGATCDLNGVLSHSRNGGKSADAERLVFLSESRANRKLLFCQSGSVPINVLVSINSKRNL
jgi:hypothetical protein